MLNNNISLGHSLLYQCTDSITRTVGYEEITVSVGDRWCKWEVWWIDKCILCVYSGRGQLLIKDVFWEACHFNKFCWYLLFLGANILKCSHRSSNGINTRQHSWPGPLFLLKRAYDLQLSHCVVPSHQKCNSHPGQTNTHTTFPHSIQSHPPYSPHVVSRFYSFILHLSFLCACRQMCFTLFTFFTLYPEHNQVSSSSICDNQLEQTEMEKV